MEFLLFLIIGGIIGIFSGFFGVGGGFILTPILLLAGFSPVIAIATSLLFTVGTSISGVVAHFKYKNIHWMIAFIIGISGIIATQVAHPFVQFIESTGYDDTIIPILYLLLLAYFSFTMLKRPNIKRPKAVKNSPSFAPISIIKYVLIGFFAGFVSTSLGVGGGFVLVPLLITFLSMDPRFAVGTSLFSVFFIVSVGFFTYSVSTPINYIIGIALVAGALVGAQAGGMLTNRFSNQEIRKMLGGLYVVTWFSLLMELLHWDIIGLSFLLVYSFVLIVLFTLRLFVKKDRTVKAS